MTRNEKIAVVILGAAAAVALYRFFSMPAKEREAFFDNIKERTGELLDDADLTVEKVNGYLELYDEEEDNAWLDKLYILKRMFKDLYGEGR